ncbi:hypothetical protein I5L51_19995 [Pseudomonas mendocina]|nr:DUF6311 domain-containing protein [Pseudomonas mendocina]MBH3341402.1 hypothetical protein [Pseudomonas mendocina]
MEIRTQPHGHILQRRLWADIHGGWAYALAWSMALSLVATLYPLTFLMGHGAFFEGGDASTNVAGWLFFRHDSWHFPLLKTTALGYPEGTSIAFTDSIPLLALPLKLFSHVLPEDFHYFGIWHALSYLLQASGAVFLIRSLGVRHLPGALLATAFALCWPAFTFRFGHTALMSQGLLLIALGLYMRGVKAPTTSQRRCFQLSILSALALLIHPYLLAMIYPLLLVFLLHQWRTQAISVRQAAGWVIGSLIALIAILVVGGYFIGKGTAAGGYGIYSLNLLAPFCGGLICAFVDGTGGQAEGFNHLGAGLLPLLPFALILAPKALIPTISRHRYLFLLLALLTLYAVSNRIYLGKWALVDIDLPHLLQGVFGIFRVSGRFFWLVGYCILFFVLALLLRRQSLAVLGLVVLAFALQWFDTRSLRDSVRAQSHQPSAIDLAAWQAALDDVQQIDLYPPYGCGTAATDGYAHYQYIAARSGLRINTGYTARQMTDCLAKSAFARQPAEARHAYIFLEFASNRLGLPPLYRDALQAGNCAIANGHLLCRSGLDNVRWDGLASPLPYNSTQTLRQQWSAEQLPSVIGHLKDGRIVARQPGTPGYLSFGPYVSLPAGIYRFRIDYVSDAEPTTQVGEWDVVAELNEQFKVLATGRTSGSAGHPAEIEGLFVLEHDAKKLEIRLHSNGGDIQLVALTVAAGHETEQTTGY